MSLTITPGQSTLSAREWLSQQTPPLAKFPSRGRFSTAAIAALDEAKAAGMTFTDPTPVKATPKPKAEKPAAAPTTTPAENGAQRAAAALARREAKAEAKREDTTVAKRPSPLAMPKRRPETSGFAVVGGILTRQSVCGNCSTEGVRNPVESCVCPEGPRAYSYIEKEFGGPLVLTLDKPKSLASA